MKVAIYIEDGRSQLVLTPETGFEKGIVSQAEKREQQVNVYTGSFYECQGGWMRQEVNLNDDDKSLIIVMSVKPEPTDGK